MQTITHAHSSFVAYAVSRQGFAKKMRFGQMKGGRFVRNARMKILAKIWCFIKGHDWVSYQLDNRDVFDGVWRSAWGNNTCVRCGKEHDWNWDRP